MGDLGGGAAATFPVALYVLLISYFALLLIPYSDLLDVLSLMCMIKYASAYVMLISVIKLTRKMPNILTIQKTYMHRQFSSIGFAADDCKKRHFYNPINALVVVEFLVFYHTFSAPTWLFLQDPRMDGNYKLSLEKDQLWSKL